MKTMTKALTTTTKTTNVQKQAARGMTFGNLRIKSVMIADVGDGAPIDDSVKIKPHRDGDGFVLKCTDIQRLVAGLASAGLDYRLVRIVRGRKHWVAHVPAMTHPSRALTRT